MKSVMREQVYGGLLGLLLVLSPALAMAQDQQTPAAESQADSGVEAQRQALNKEIGDQKDRRNGAIAGFAVGGAVVIGGLIAAAIKAQKEADESAQNGGDGRAHEFNWIGLGIGLPIIGISAYVFADAQKNLNRLMRRRTQLSLTPVPQGARLGMSVDF